MSRSVVVSIDFSVADDADKDVIADWVFDLLVNDPVVADSSMIVSVDGSWSEWN